MTVDIATLAIRVDSSEARTARRDLDGIATSGNRAEQAVKAMAAIFATIKAAEALIETQRAFDKLNASLITATGSVQNAAQAFGALQSFAASTPYGLAEVTKAFIQLRNLGLTPSERALNSYGNTASAMSKSLNQMVEAVADAATGEFERLKEFGIKAKQNGDQVSLTFQGVTSNIANNAASIEKYLIELGETKFGGGMELQARTLDGAISNLGDTWEATKLKFSQSGFGDEVYAATLGLTGALFDLGAMFDVVTGAAEREAGAVQEASGLHKTLTTAFETITVLGMNVAYVLTQVGNELGGLAAQAVAVATGDFALAKQIGVQMKADAEQARKEIDARSESVIGAGERARKAAEAEAAAKKAAGRDDLERYAIVRTAAGQSAEAAKKAAAEYAASIKAANEFITALKNEASEVGLTADQVKMMAAARAAAKAPTAELRMEIMKAALALDIETKAFAASEVARKSVADATQVLADNRAAEYEAIAAEVKANNDAITTYGLSKSAIEALTLARMQDRLARRGPQDLDLDEAEVQHLERMIALQKEKAATTTTLGGLDAGSSVTQAKELLDILVAVDNAAKSAAQGMTESFGRVGSAIGGLTTALSGYAVQQQAIAAQLAAIKADPKSGADKIAKAEMAASKASAQAQIKSYGDMAGAAKGFFKENSKGYKLLEATEKAFRAYEMAMALESMVTKLFTVNAVTAATIGGETLKSAAVVAGTEVQLAADLTKGTSAAAVAVATQAEGDPYTAWARMAAMVAVMAGLGFAVSGGGGSKSVSQQRQESQGTGSVFGDSSAKSDSIARSIELAATNSSIELTHTAGMLASLKAIENSIGGLGSLLIRGTDVTSLAGSVAPTSSGGFWGGLVSSIFGGKTTVQDTGVSIGKGSLADIMAGGVNSQSYIDTKKSGGWFSSSKYNTQTKDLGAEVDDQFTKVILGLGESITTAAGLLGLGGDAFTQKLNSFVVDIGKISLKDLKGEEIQQALEAVFSKLGDDMAQFGVGGLESFQQVGEGYFETLTRIATNYANLNSIMESIGTTFGATGMASIAARENLIALAGGIDELASQTTSFADNFLTEAERLAPVQKYVTDQLAAMGLQSLDTRDKFKDYVLSLANSGALATEAGAQQYTALLALADAFAKTHAATEDLTKSEQAIADERKDLMQQYNELTMTAAQLAAQARAAIAPYNLALYDQVQALKGVSDAQATLLSAYEKQKAALQSVVDLQNAAANATQKQIDALKLGALSNLSPEQKYLEAQRQFDAAAAGDAKNAAAQVLLQASRDYNGSTGAYQADYAKVQAALVTQVAAQRSAASIAQQQLTALDKQVGELIDINTGVDSLNGTMQSLQAAILGLGSSMLALANANAAAGKPGGSNTSLAQGAVDGVLTGLYQNLLGRAPDAEGLKFWQEVAASGQSYDQIVEGIKGSSEYKALHGSHRNGLEYVPFDGYRAELHRGERVQTASQVSSDKDSNAQIVQLLGELVVELQADKQQRGAVAVATLEKLDTVASNLASTKRELARA